MPIVRLRRSDEQRNQSCAMKRHQQSQLTKPRATRRGETTLELINGQWELRRMLSFRYIKIRIGMLGTYMRSYICSYIILIPHRLPECGALMHSSHPEGTSVAAGAACTLDPVNISSKENYLITFVRTYVCTYTRTYIHKSLCAYECTYSFKYIRTYVQK